jgi:electron transfer flavoprotein beta subunit
MKILVTAKRVEHPESKIKIKEDGSGIITDGLKYVINYFDEIALEEAVRLKETHEAEVVAVSIEASGDTQHLLTARAIGADRAIVVKVDEMPDPNGVAEILKAVVDKEEPNLILMGKQAIDDDSNVVGQLLAEYLGWPQATFASKEESFESPEEKAKKPAIQLEDDVAIVTREVDGGLEILEVQTPCIITAHDRLCQPRYPALPNIIKAKKKPLDELTLDDLGVSITPRVTVLGYEPLPERQAGVMVESVEELLEKLQSEAKVL